MGQICSSREEKSQESKEVFNSFKTAIKKNIFNFNINNYDKNCSTIKSLSKNTFEKLGQMQQMRVNFIQELRDEINKMNDITYNINNNYQIYENINNNYNFNEQLNYFEFNNLRETEKILYYIIITKIILESYLKRNYISNELETSLLELSIVILKKNYNKYDLKLILYHLSRMFEILFKHTNNIQNYININDYLFKIKTITDDLSVLSKEEKYPFILTHIISLGEIFHNDNYNNLIDASNKMLLIQYYTYLIINNYDFILKNYSNYKNKIMKNFHFHFNNTNNLANYTYNKNDLIESDTFSENTMKKTNDLMKITNSFRLFLIISSQDTLAGKNIFYYFDNQLELAIKSNILDNEANIIKFKDSCFMNLFSNFLFTNNSSTMLLSFFEYYSNNKNLDIYNNEIYYEMLVSLFGKSNNNNKIFLDKYTYILSQFFIIEKENYINNNLILDKLYNHIYYSSNKNYGIQNINEKQINYENFYFIINLIKYISIYYRQLQNIKTAYDILINLTNFLYKLRGLYKKSVILNQNNISSYIHLNFNESISNFNYNKNDFYTNLYEPIQIPLSNFLAIYFILFNDFYKIKEDNFVKNKLDFSIITTITYLEISLIKNPKKENIQMIIHLLKIYIYYLETKKFIDTVDTKNNLNNNLNLLINETSIPINIYGKFNQNFQFNTFHLIIIYGVILIILITCNNKNNNLSDLKLKHNNILNNISQNNSFLYSHTFKNMEAEDLQYYNIKRLKLQISNTQIFNIEKFTFQKIIYIIRKILFNNEEEEEEEENYQNFSNYNEFRTRTIYQRGKKNEININLNTKNNDDFYYTPNNILDNNIFNDTYSQISHKSTIYKRNNIYNLNMSQNQSQNHFHNLSDNDLFSEKVNLPIKDNNTFLSNEQNKTMDIMSEKSSYHINLKI